MKESWEAALNNVRKQVRKKPMAFITLTLIGGTFFGVLWGATASSDAPESHTEQIAELHEELADADKRADALRLELAGETRSANRWRRVAKGAARRSRPVVEHPEPEPAPQPEPAPDPPSPREELRAALRNVNAIGEDPKIKEVNFLEGNTLNVIAETPLGGFQGPSTTDLNYMSRAIFETIYGPSAPAHEFATVIEFTGGLVDQRTGQESDAVTARYMIEQTEAQEIAWADKTTLDFINWSFYRTFTHPAIKDDD